MTDTKDTATEPLRFAWKGGIPEGDLTESGFGGHGLTVEWTIKVEATP